MLTTKVSLPVQSEQTRICLSQKLMKSSGDGGLATDTPYDWETVYESIFQLFPNIFP